MDLVVVAPGSRVLCRTVLAVGQILNMHLMEVHDNRVDLQPFTIETEATIFESSPVIVVKKDCISDKLINDIIMLLNLDNPLSLVNDYLILSGMYSSQDVVPLVINQ